MTAAQSTEKPAKPYPDYPLTAHKSGQWRKRFRGKDYYCGPWSNPDEALEEWRRIEASLTLGIDPAKPELLTIEDLCDLYTASKEDLYETGQRSRDTLDDAKAGCKHLLGYFGRHRPAESFGPSDFTAYRKAFPKNWGPRSIQKQIVFVRSLFNWGVTKQGCIDRAPVYGEVFDPPSAKAIKADRRKKPQKKFTGEEIHSLLHHADVQMHAMILLALNAGYGNRDCARLEWSMVKGEWLDEMRGKTGNDRRAWLWPITRKALRDVKKHRERSKVKPVKGCEDLVFIKHDGNPWVMFEPRKLDAITNRFAKIKRAADCHRSGNAFYSLRHTFKNVADQKKDFVTVEYIMGHLRDPADMQAHYAWQRKSVDDTDGISDSDVKAVCQHVLNWLNKCKPKRKTSRTVESKAEGN